MPPVVFSDLKAFRNKEASGSYTPTVAADGSSISFNVRASQCCSPALSSTAVLIVDLQISRFVDPQKDRLVADPD